MSFAAQTQVSPEKSQLEIQRTLRKYGASKFGVMEGEDGAHVMFEFNRLMIQISVKLPDRSRFTKTEGGHRTRSASSQEAAFEQAVRQRWRALMLCIKAKLEAVETGISTVEKEFLAFVIMPDGRALAEHIGPQLKQLADTGKMEVKLLGR